MDDTSTRLERQIAFILELDRLKTVLRRTYVPGTDRHEDSAEHSWQLAVAVLLLAEHANQPVNLLRVVTLALVHDIVEIEAGDTFAYDAAANASKAERERAAADKLFGMLPPEQAAELRRAWDEYEEATTPEALFVASLDRLLPILHNVATHGRSWREHGITAARVLQRNSCIDAGSRALWQLAQARLAGAVTRGDIAER